MDPITDQALVEEVLKGRKESYALILDRYKTKVYGLLRSMGATSVDAQDLAQETFIKAYCKLSQYQFDSNFAAWLYKIAVNTLKDFYRKKIPIPIEDAYGALEQKTQCRQEEQITNVPEQNYLSKELREEFRKLLQTLPEQCRLIIVLRYSNELSYREIASIVGVSESKVTNSIHRAKKKLKKQLGQKGGDSFELLESIANGKSIV
ncbi:sigma-70 family RNA polymerase sigma factor [Paenibacillus turicensis]|uniref:RNA polymerase sigma factor n=1 Tax=Paenibacillus turicensis TaxID=160487 RepID=UPI003D2C9090